MVYRSPPITRGSRPKEEINSQIPDQSPGRAHASTLKSPKNAFSLTERVRF